jgi:hypothetical protein
MAGSNWEDRAPADASYSLPVETEVAQNQQANIHFSMEKGMEIMNLVPVFPYIRELCQQLRGWSSLVI